MATSLPPGFRFHPTDVELVRYYLKRKVTGKPLRFEAISEIDLYKFAPWDLPEMSCLQHKDLEWFFFCPRDRKYANGSRANRATDIGYWKTTGKDRSIIYNTQIVGMKKTLVFHIGRGSEGTRTDWVMYEYRMEDKELVNAGFSQDAFVLCKIFQKSGSGPKNGEQYGAPFKEEDWDDDQAILSIPALKQSATSGIVKVLSEFNGLLEQLVEDANGSSNFQENALSEITGSIILHKNSAEVSDEDIQHMYNDLENLSNQMELTPIDSMYFVDCVENENVLELNDLHFPWESDHSDWFVPNELFGHDPSFHDLNSSDIPTFPTDSGVTTASVVGNSLPRGPDNFDDQLALITEMDSSSGNIKWQYEADTLRISAATWGAGECESNYSIHELAGGGVCNSYSEIIRLEDWSGHLILRNTLFISLGFLK